MIKKRKKINNVTKVLSSAARNRAARHKLIFNLFPHEYEKILAYQNYTCPITGLKPPRFVIDHDHATGKIRGCLEWRINKALGHFKDNATWLRNAADYLDNCPATAALGEEVFGVIGKVTRMAKNRRYGPNNTKTPQPRKLQ